MKSTDELLEALRDDLRDAFPSYLVEPPTDQGGARYTFKFLKKHDSTPGRILSVSLEALADARPAEILGYLKETENEWQAKGTKRLALTYETGKLQHAFS